jgi:hypothetical protein
MFNIRNETFDIMVFDKETQFVELFVYDYDMGTASDFLGKVTVNLDTLPNFETAELDLDLLETDTGSIQLICEYTPLKKTEAQKNKENDAGDTPDDVIFNFSPTALSTDMLEKEVLKEDSDDQDTLIDDDSSVGPVQTSGGLSKLSGAASVVNGLKKRVSHVRGDGAMKNDTPIVDKPRPVSVPKSPLKSANRGVLTVSCIRGRNFKLNSMLSSTVRPYIILSVGNKKMETSVQKDHHDPAFDEIFNFVVHDPTNSVLQVKIMHDNRLRGDSQLADLSIRLHDVANHMGPLDREYLLNSKQEDMYFSCRLEWSATV